jgi:ADP-ribose pyrophosphatase
MMKLVSSRERYRCGLFWVSEDRARDSTGFEIRRSIVHHAGSAVMMAVDAQGRILLVRQYRLPAGAQLWELPAGRLDPGENPLQAARRELMEETGYRARRWDKLISFYPSPGYISEKMTIFLATGLTAGKAQPMDDERIECRWFRAREIERMIRTNRVQDAKTMIGFFVWNGGRYRASAH